MKRFEEKPASQLGLYSTIDYRIQPLEATGCVLWEDEQFNIAHLKMDIHITMSETDIEQQEQATIWHRNLHVEPFAQQNE